MALLLLPVPSAKISLGHPSKPEARILWVCLEGFHTITEDHTMRRYEKSQRVNIDEYFDGFEDVEDPLAVESHWPMEAVFLVSQPLKAIFTDNVGQAAPVLAPYQHQSSVLSEPKLLSPFELEAAHRAVSSIKSQLIGEPDSSVQAQVFPPSAWDVTPQHRWLAQASSVSPMGSTFSRFFTTRPVAMVKGISLIWWGSLVAIVGTTVAAMALYAHSPYPLHPHLAQAQTLGQRTWAKTQAHLAKPMPSVGLMTNHTDEQAAMAQSMELAYTAAELTQSATTHEDWLQVITFWRRAIDELQPIPTQSDLFKAAQERRQLYQKNLTYAQGELEMAPFRIAVVAAESASQMAANAMTLEDWAEVAAKWQEALSHMESVPAQSSRYEVAQEKLAEYATKFAYSQNRYLTLQTQGTW